ncbi:MAG: response regulator transcription factor [Clostridia bacterium]|jgi:DNA-binding response OmpR family regulator|nr:response regulator transcription factor [Clostridia bacterium]MBO7400153.1 response regulator transcription factor [Clostridia bacterium]MBO7548519.1 response regulator transcription factor [Clostridia bacterium]MBO7666393.1 response regulator transcription factor [Clostridia bacterium]MBP5237900.1 response regulator transcription factor [Clostridia bacterium]
MNILVVDDEKRFADGICEILSQQKIHCEAVYDGRDGYDYGVSGIYDVILLDIMLPGMNGFEVLKKLRAAKVSTPIILLTARDEVTDKVRGLDSGADDYLTKPFLKEELMARIRAVSRRKGEVILNELSFGDITLGLDSCTLSCAGNSVKLGFKEFEILKLLMSNPGAAISKEELITKVWGYLSDAEDNNVEVYISFIRKKLAFVGSSVSISTVRRVGYVLEAGK